MLRFQKLSSTLLLFILSVLFLLPESVSGFSESADAAYLSPVSGVAATEANRLDRISAARRSDGLGYVIRFHFSARPDSFRVFQPEKNLIQFAVYSSGEIQLADNLQLPEPFGDVRITQTAFGLGFDIPVHSDTPYLAQSYIDQNRRHVLVGLTEISEREIDRLTGGLAPLAWNPEPNGSSETRSAEAAPAEAGLPEEAVFPEIPLPAPAGAANGAAGSELVNWMVFDTIVIDAGHGGRDPGAIGASGSFEKDIVLAVALKVGEYINQYMPELNVVYTRNDDTFVGLAERGRIANRNNGHLFVSIHTNAHTGRQANGAEFYILGQGRTQSALEVMRRENAVTRFEDQEDRPEELTDFMLLTHIMQNSGNIRQSETFAGLLEQQFAQRAQRRTRGVKQAGLQVLFEASMPGVLVELGFISNPQEERFMKSDYGQAILASAIFRAIRDYKDLIQRRQRGQQVPTD